MPDRYDVIVIGTGAGGGTLAHTLAASGRRVLLLERGNFLPRESENWDPEPVFLDGRYISPDTWYDADGTAFQPQVHYFVGGATKLYGAALYRLRPQDFGPIQHVDGVSPAWPLTYDDFEPWYTKAEWLYQVHGHHGEDPTEGTWSKQYPWPAVSHEPRIQQIADDLAGGRLPPVLGAVRHPPRRGRPSPQHVHPLHLVRRLPLPRARQVRRRDHRRAAAADGAERHAARRGGGRQAGDRRRRRQRHGCRRLAGGPGGDVPGRHRRRCRPGRRTAPRSCSGRPTTAIRTASPTAPTRSDATTCSTTPRPSWRWPRNATTPCSRRRWASTTSTSAAPTTAGRSGTSRWSASPTAGR